MQISKNKTLNQIVNELTEGLPLDLRLQIFQAWEMWSENIDKMIFELNPLPKVARVNLQQLIDLQGNSLSTDYLPGCVKAVIKYLTLMIRVDMADFVDSTTHQSFLIVFDGKGITRIHSQETH